MFLRGIARVGWSSTTSSGAKPNSARVRSRSPRAGSRSNALRRVTASKPRFSSCTREWSLMVTCSEFGRCGGTLGGVGRPARCHGRSWWWNTTRPSCASSTVAASADASGLIGSEQRFSTITRSAPGDRGRELVRRGRGVVGRIDGEEGERDVVGRGLVVELAGDPAHREAELVQRPLPLAGLDGHAVGAAEPVRELDGDRRHRARGSRGSPRDDGSARTCDRVRRGRDDGWWRRAARGRRRRRDRGARPPNPETTSSVGGST